MKLEVTGIPMADTTIAPNATPSLPHVRPDILLRSFQPGDEEAFRVLNEQWIAKYFRIEDKDRETLGDPVSKILAHGGHIFFALKGEKKVGTCALIPTEPVVYEVARLTPSSYEVAKMAVEEGYAEPASAAPSSNTPSPKPRSSARAASTSRPTTGWPTPSTSTNPSASATSIRPASSHRPTTAPTSSWR
jgi:hypothetical protein